MPKGKPLKNLLLASIAALFLIWAGHVHAQVNENTPGWYRFTVPGLDASATATDLSRLNPGRAGADGFIRVKDGHFADGTGRRIRFFGTNVTAKAAFPDKKDAPRIAAHLRKLGFNAIRLHF